MKNLLFLNLILFASTQFASVQASTPVTAELISRLEAKRDIVRTWAPTCEDGTQSHGYCPFNDMAIFSGMSCLSGEAERCNDVKMAQGPDGRWWRSPQLVGNNEEINSFSRDQAKGVLAYLVATKDVQAALRWQAYLDANNQKMCTNAKDNRCTITSGSSRLFGAVWEYLGLKPAPWMNRGKWLAQYYDQIEASVQPSNFPMHLNALNAWVRLEIERRGGPRAESVDTKVLKILVKREPNNPFFLLLRSGPTAEVAKMILEKCPDEMPVGFSRLDWAWQRSHEEESRPWLQSSGHDCIFIINAFQREIALKNQ